VGARRPLRILVATENTLPARAAIRFGARIAAATGGEVVALAVGTRFPQALAGSGGLGSRLASALNEAARAYSANALDETRKQAERTGARIRFETLTPRRVESMAETISRAADRERADLVVVGSLGGIVPARWALGSFASQLIHVVRRPIAVVPDTYRDSTRRVVKIVVATDGSKAAGEAVRSAARLAARIPRARLLILEVATLAADLSLLGGRLVKALGFVPDLRRAEFRAARAVLEGAAREARRLGARVTVRYLVPRKPITAESAIASEAARQRADLIVVGNSGRSALGDAFLGSVAQRVLSIARRPVILVRARRR
jgi:nucleotide-binding universal stress UspA family protein